MFLPSIDGLRAENTMGLPSAGCAVALSAGLRKRGFLETV